jgi:hypothetical protein
MTMPQDDEVCFLCTLESLQLKRVPIVDARHLKLKHRKYGIFSRRRYLHFKEDFVRLLELIAPGKSIDTILDKSGSTFVSDLKKYLAGYTTGVATSFTASILYDLVKSSSEEYIIKKLVQLVQTWEQDKIRSQEATKRLAAKVQEELARRVPDSYFAFIGDNIPEYLADKFLQAEDSISRRKFLSLPKQREREFVPILIPQFMVLDLLGDFPSKSALSILENVINRSDSIPISIFEKDTKNIKIKDMRDSALLQLILALRSLGRISKHMSAENRKRIVSNLIQLLDQKKHEIPNRAFFAEALGLTGDERALPKLVALHRDIQDKWKHFQDNLGDKAVRNAIARVANEKVIDVLIDSLKHDDTWVRVNAFVGLARLRGLNSMNFLRQVTDLMAPDDPARPILNAVFQEIFGYK